ncbi:hypothetical protein JB92DRAFT_3111358 [Gautieria morchelliformis]|nr:hypothetical protein JB92DRAFT_3111358 [Gautieria morchelliformis]
MPYAIVRFGRRHNRAPQPTNVSAIATHTSCGPGHTIAACLSCFGDPAAGGMPICAPGSKGPDTQTFAPFLSQVAIEESILQLVPPRAHQYLETFLAKPGAHSAPHLAIVPVISQLISPWVQRNAPVPRAVFDALPIKATDWREDRWGHGTHSLLSAAGPVILPYPMTLGMSPLVTGVASAPSTTQATKRRASLMESCVAGARIQSAMDSTAYLEGRDAMMSSLRCSHDGLLLPSWLSFFADTLFAMDDFHSGGHTKCSQASFLSTYADLDPWLAAVNTSAAECGNGGLNQIRKGAENPADDGG